MNNKDKLLMYRIIVAILILGVIGLIIGLVLKKGKCSDTSLECKYFPNGYNWAVNNNKLSSPCNSEINQYVSCPAGGPVGTLWSCSD